ncbi:hypothetical protein [Rhodococcus sp. NCIMB 12038]|uniref:LEM-3-like GIY-YIG domain-containing protein n=1 Tax=Rhodococcus sp. NCIMB 12038 TaxID=933800 RepID=UPI0011798A78|nr:hypothetical protein [Rhodococcus sp. NCIMB 12038]
MAAGFDAHEIEELAFYVYVYTDPRSDQPFYVGKGQGNRAFAHLSATGEHEKVQRITEIRGAGFEPRIEILAFGLDEVTAYKVEAAAIDLIGFENLTNKVVGHGARRFGRMSVDAVHARLSARKLERFEHRCIAITVTNSLALARERLGSRFEDSSDDAIAALYDATRGTWRVDLRRAESCEFALAVNGGVVREVYRIAQWLPGGSTHYVDSALTPLEDRYEFVGRSPTTRYARCTASSRSDPQHRTPSGTSNPVTHSVDRPRNHHQAGE